LLEEKFNFKKGREREKTSILLFGNGSNEGKHFSREVIGSP
jgi:hypothetical protein